jgi:hypothetical protein
MEFLKQTFYNMKSFTSLAALLLSYYVGPSPHLLTALISSVATMVYVKKSFSTDRLNTRCLMTDQLYFSDDCRMHIVGDKLLIESYMMGGWTVQHTTHLQNSVETNDTSTQATDTGFGVEFL